MVRHMIAISVFLVFSVFLLSETAIANTLSDTYYQAFVDPYGFDGYLNDNVVLDPDYYDKFDNCFQPTISILNRMENQLHQQHSTCPNNAVCTQIAKDIQSVINLRLNVRNLDIFIRSTRSDAKRRFQNSDIGRAAITVYNFHRQRGIVLRRNRNL